MMRFFLISFLMMRVFGSIFAQTDSIKLNLISERLELEKYNDQFEFYVDTLIKVNNYSIYSVMPFTSSFSFCIVFKDDYIVTDSKFPGDMNKMPYVFETYSEGEDPYVSTYWYGDGTTSTSLNLYILKLGREGIDVVFNDIIYYEDKDSNEVLEINSFSIFSDLTIRKFSNDQRDSKLLVNRFDLPINIRESNQIRDIEEFEIP